MATDGDEARDIWIDRAHPQIYRAQIEVAKAVRAAVADAGLDRILVELVNVRVSQLNRCAFCLHIHTRDALRAGETTQRLGVLPAWRETPLFTDAERAALTLAESLTLLPDSSTQDRDQAEARVHLSDEQFSAVCWVIVAMNAFNRISIVSHHPVPLAAAPKTTS